VDQALCGVLKRLTLFECRFPSVTSITGNRYGWVL